jgi:hypothetical protein
MRGAGLLLILLVLGAVLAVAGTGYMAPTRLAFLQEQVLGFVHGGIAHVEEDSSVQSCVYINEGEPPKAVTRIRRTVFFRDGTSLEITFNGVPTASDAQCP